MMRPIVSTAPRTPTTPPALLVLVVALIGTELWFGGGVAVADWAPVALLVLTAVAFLGPGEPPRRLTHGFAAGLALFGAWTLASAAWSDAPGRAVEAGARGLLYAGLAALVVATLPDRASAVRAARWLTVALGAIVLAAAAGLVIGRKDVLLAGRLDDPVGYRNGTAALMAMAAVALLCAAAPRGANPLARGGAFAGAVVALELAFLSQSRGVLLGLGCGLAVAVGLGPDRLRRAWLAVAAVTVVAAFSSALLAPYDAFLATRFVAEADVTRAVEALLAGGLIALPAMTGAALLDSSGRMGAGVERRLRRGGAALLALLALAGAGAGLVRVGDPVAFARDKVHEFTALDRHSTGATRLGSTSGQRYDLWRIAVREWRSAPLVGAGSGSYAARYYRERATDRNLWMAHSLVLEALGDLGLAGAVLLGGTFVLGGLGVARGWRDLGAGSRRVASAVLGAGVVLVAQCTVDWMWAIAALAGLAVVALAVGLRVATAPETPAARSGRAVGWRAVAAAGALLVATLSVSATYLGVARAHRDDPARSLAAARTAVRFNPLSVEGLHLQAGALESRGDVAGSRKVLMQAMDAEPRSFVTPALLGDLEVRAGLPARARRHYRRALRMNPRDVGLQELARFRG